MRLLACIQGTPEWHQARTGVITASMYSAAVGLTSTLTPQQRLYVEAIQSGDAEIDARIKAGYKSAPRSESVADALAGKPTTRPSLESVAYCDEIAIERVSEEPYGDVFQTFAMKRGSEEEFWARARYSEIYDCEVEEAGIALTDDGNFGYSTDGFVGDKGMIEVKTPLNIAKIRAIIETNNTDEYTHQIQGGLWLTGREWCDFIMYVPALRKIGNDVYVKRIFRDESFIEKLELDLWAFHLRAVEAEKFWLKKFRRDGATVIDVESRVVPDIVTIDGKPLTPVKPKALRSSLAGLLSA